MTHIVAADAQAWADGVKLPITSLDAGLEDAQSTIVLAKLGQAYDTTSWSDSSSTPALVKKLIAMRYVAFTIDRTYSEDEDVNAYAALLLKESDALIDGLVSGSITIPGLPTGVDQALGRPAFYPTDASSALCATPDDMSLGGPKFSMGQIF